MHCQQVKYIQLRFESETIHLSSFVESSKIGGRRKSKLPKVTGCKAVLKMLMLLFATFSYNDLLGDDCVLGVVQKVIRDEKKIVVTVVLYKK